MAITLLVTAIVWPINDASALPAPGQSPELAATPTECSTGASKGRQLRKAVIEVLEKSSNGSQQTVRYRTTLSDKGPSRIDVDDGVTADEIRIWKSEKQAPNILVNLRFRRSVDDGHGSRVISFASAAYVRLGHKVIMGKRVHPDGGSLTITVTLQ